MTDEKRNEIIAKCARWFVISATFFALLFILLWFGLQLEWIKKTTSVTDALAFVAITVAAGTAVYGWGRADRIAQKARKEAKQDTKEVRERNAKADAIIFVGRLAPFDQSLRAFFLDLITPAGSDVVTSFAVATNRKQMLDNFENLVNLCRGIQEITPNAEVHFNSMHSLLVSNQSLGTEYVILLNQLQYLKASLQVYSSGSPQSLMKYYERGPNLAMTYFYSFLANITRVLIQMETLRRKLDGTEFTAPLSGEKLRNMKSRLEEICNFEIKKSDTKSFSEAEMYLRILQSARDFFSAQAAELHAEATSELAWDR